MHLKEYLKKNEISIATFSRVLGCSVGTLHHILTGGDLKLSLALEIERITFGKVTCSDLKPSKIIASKPEELESEKEELYSDDDLPPCIRDLPAHDKKAKKNK